MILTFEKFRAAACVLLSGMAGFLIALPLTYDREPAAATLIVAACSVLGAIGGCRRRSSVAYFYFCLVCVTILAWIVSFRYFQIEI